MVNESGLSHHGSERSHESAGKGRTAQLAGRRDRLHGKMRGIGQETVSTPPRYIGWVRISLILLRSCRVVMGPAAGPSPFATGDDATIA